MLKRYWVVVSTFLMVVLFGFMLSCSSNEVEPEPKPVPEPEPEPTDSTLIDSASVDASKFYLPKEFSKMNFYKTTSKWSFARSRQSDHFIVFWGAGYKENDPNSSEVPAAYRVDIDDLLVKAEEFYDMNVNHLKFAETGVGKSNLDKYKIMIFLHYQTEWLATGAGYDDVIGALWISPNTCQPVGHTIGHEIGHSFQYQVFADLKNGAGFRYGFGGNGGNAFWEQTAQFQGFQSFPEQVFTAYDFNVYVENYHRHVHHEWYRYASYFMHYYWQDKHGDEMVGKIWRQAKSPEDPMQAYMRITGISVEQLNSEIYDAATKFATWDIDALRNQGKNFIGAQTFNSTKLADGSYQVAYDRCPGTTGYNLIRLNVPAPGTVVTTSFTGMVNAEGFNQVSDPEVAGWRYGYVALLEDGTRVYSDMNSGTTNNVSFTIPSNCQKLWFVVTGAPSSYAPHPWDEDESNDDQWPYKIKFQNTELFGNVTFDGTEVPADLTLTYNVSFPFSSSEYPGINVQLSSDDLVKLAKAFVMQPSDIKNEIDNGIDFFAVESDGTLNATRTAVGLGHWYNTPGNVIAWGPDAMVFSEFTPANWTFALGQYPGHCIAGTTYTIKQALVYEYEEGKSVQATFVFNIKIE